MIAGHGKPIWTLQGCVMKLSLELLAVDFESLGIATRFGDGAQRCNLSFGDVPSADAPLKPGRLYLANPDDIDPAAINAAPFTPGFALTRAPSDELLATKANMLWFESPITLPRLITLVAERFDYYNQWELAILESVNRGDPIRDLGKISEPVLNRPLIMWDALLQTVFSVWEESHYELPPNFFDLSDMSAWPEAGFEETMEFLKKEQPNKEAYILPPIFGYRSLCKNLFIDGEHIATISADEVDREFNARDYVLIDVLAKHLTANLRFNPQVVVSTTDDMRMHLEHMLSRQPVSSNDIEGDIAKMGWSVSDTYFCMVVAPRTSSYSDPLLSVIGDRMARKSGETVYTVFEHAIVLVVNQSMANRSVPDEARTYANEIERLLKCIESEEVDASVGISGCYRSFFELEPFYRQARRAIELGEKSGGNDRYFKFDDFLVDHLVDRVLEDASPDTVYLSGLSRLLEYDRRNGTDLIETLAAYLANDMWHTKTAAALYMHRNTLSNRLKIIERVGGMDLSDPDVQLALRFGLRVIRGTGR